MGGSPRGGEEVMTSSKLEIDQYNQTPWPLRKATEFWLMVSNCWVPIVAILGILFGGLALIWVGTYLLSFRRVGTTPAQQEAALECKRPYSAMEEVAEGVGEVETCSTSGEKPVE
jgi:hypothetical protein